MDFHISENHNEKGEVNTFITCEFNFKSLVDDYCDYCLVQTVESNHWDGSDFNGKVDIPTTFIDSYNSDEKSKRAYASFPFFSSSNDAAENGYDTHFYDKFGRTPENFNRYWSGEVSVLGDKDGDYVRICTLNWGILIGANDSYRQQIDLTFCNSPSLFHQFVINNLINHY